MHSLKTKTIKTATTGPKGLFTTAASLMVICSNLWFSFVAVLVMKMQQLRRHKHGFLIICFILLAIDFVHTFLCLRTRSKFHIQLSLYFPTVYWKPKALQIIINSLWKGHHFWIERFSVTCCLKWKFVSQTVISGHLLVCLSMSCRLLPLLEPPKLTAAASIRRQLKTLD